MSRSIVPQAISGVPWGMLALVCALTCFGLVVLYSAANGSVRPWALNQSWHFIIFLIGSLFLARLGEERLKLAALPIFAFLCFSLLGVEALGAVSGGSRRWLDLKVIRFQPSELMKPVIVLAIARYYDLVAVGDTRRLQTIVPAAVMIGIPFLLVLVQPDLGTALMIAFGGIVTMFLAGVPLWLFGAGIAAIAALTPLALHMMHDYQRNRIEIFLNPESDPRGTGYHIIQSKIAIGSGGLTGKGFLAGTQSHLDYLPEGQTDFVFATMAEEWGLVGGVAIIVAYLLVIRWGMGVAMRAQSRFARVAAGGLATTIFFYMAINLAMVMGLAPVVGIPLPLVSFGGSAMMTVLICLGLLMTLDPKLRPRRTA